MLLNLPIIKLVMFIHFLTTPLQAFCLLIGLIGSDIEMDTLNRAETLLSLSYVIPKCKFVVSHYMQQTLCWLHVVNISTTSFPLANVAVSMFNTIPTLVMVLTIIPTAFGFGFAGIHYLVHTID